MPGTHPSATLGGVWLSGLPGHARLAAGSASGRGGTASVVMAGHDLPGLSPGQLVSAHRAFAPVLRRLATG
jgi:hypothetical protein